ncbi:hypothetical protein QJ043_08330 [Olsenella sp. YH-ols2217]|uniref:Uncharacterized protein n=1 Tax=Kribbibacterium absianum TaxID=3044210 RepID=A0ABT6ZLZ8_9ACTN|nr:MULTISPECIES: hypothetical protein [unclassified Olsenella]MDJ1122071.1 hypothetical protein [Olsenella sp. YH-ols2216]MDJ1130079.1 hypothetical protein [Olsenella sp. YH-ols2217]
MGPYCVVEVNQRLKRGDRLPGSFATRDEAAEHAVREAWFMSVGAQVLETAGRPFLNPQDYEYIVCEDKRHEGLNMPWGTVLQLRS